MESILYNFKECDNLQASLKILKNEILDFLFKNEMEELTLKIETIIQHNMIIFSLNALQINLSMPWEFVFIKFLILQKLYSADIRYFYYIHKMGSQNSSLLKITSISQQQDINFEIAESINDQKEQNSLSKQIKKLNPCCQIQASKEIFSREQSRSSDLNNFQNQVDNMIESSLSNDGCILEFRDFCRSEILSQNHLDINKTIPEMTNIEKTNKRENKSPPQIRDQNVFDFYRILEKVGQVNPQNIRVQNINTNQIRVLKIIQKVTFRQKYLIRGQTEFQNLSKLDHPNIIKCYQMFEDINKFYLILQYIEGQTLFNLMSSMTITQEMGQFIIRNTLQTLQYMHSKNIIHRDIKPDNIMICPDTSRAQPNFIKIKIINFGLSIDLNREPIKKQIFGTVYYASPESFEGSINQKYDIWSLGIMTINLFTQTNPAKYISETHRLNTLRRGNAYNQLLKNLSESVKQFVTQMLIVKNRKRPSAEEALKIQWISGQKNLYKNYRKRNSIQQKKIYFP